MDRTLVLGVALAVTLVFDGCASPAKRHGLPVPSDVELAEPITWDTFDTIRLAHAIFHESNQVRAAHGLRPLRAYPRLSLAAELQAATAAMLGQASHDNPLPGQQNVAERVRSAGVDSTSVAENVLAAPLRMPPSSETVAFTYAELAERIVEQWLASPVHRRNLLNGRYRYLACGAAPMRGAFGREMTIAVQVFMARRSAGRGAVDPQH